MWLQCWDWKHILFFFSTDLIFRLTEAPFSTTVNIDDFVLEQNDRLSMAMWFGKTNFSHSTNTAIIDTYHQSETIQKLCLSTKFPHQEITWNYSISRSINSPKTSSHCLNMNNKANKYVNLHIKRNKQTDWIYVKTAYGHVCSFMVFLQAILIKYITIFNELNGCCQKFFVDVIIKFGITVKNYSK